MDREILREFTVPELVVLQHKLRQFAEDKDELAEVMEEIKKRAVICPTPEEV